MELLLAFFGNLKIYFAILATLAAIYILISGTTVDTDYRSDSETNWIKWRARMRFWVMSVVVLSLLVCIPDVNDLCRVRIGLIKYHLASPENLKAGTDTIERVAKKLECKYLGCDEEKKK